MWVGWQIQGWKWGTGAAFENEKVLPLQVQTIATETGFSALATLWNHLRSSKKVPQTQTTPLMKETRKERFTAIKPSRLAWCHLRVSAQRETQKGWQPWAMTWAMGEGPGAQCWRPGSIPDAKHHDRQVPGAPSCCYSLWPGRQETAWGCRTTPEWILENTHAHTDTHTKKKSLKTHQLTWEEGGPHCKKKIFSIFQFSKCVHYF